MSRARKPVFKAPAYLPKVAALLATLPNGDANVHHITVRHDEWCDRLKDPPGECNCDPDLGPLKGSS
jgi:hypothetical protein